MPDALIALLSPYFAQLPTGSTVSDTVPLMTDVDRAEYERLRGLVAPGGCQSSPSTRTDSHRGTCRSPAFSLPDGELPQGAMTLAKAAGADSEGA